MFSILQTIVGCNSYTLADEDSVLRRRKENRHAHAPNAMKAEHTSPPKRVCAHTADISVMTQRGLLASRPSTSPPRSCDSKSNAGIHIGRGWPRNVWIPEDNMKIWDTLRNWKHVQAMLPALTMIMSQLENMQEQIAQIRGELQQDRLAKADTAWDQLHQALKITDRRRCEQSIMMRSVRGNSESPKAFVTLTGTNPPVCKGPT